MNEKYCKYETISSLCDELLDVFSDNIGFFAIRGRQIDNQLVSAFERITNVVEPTRIALEELTKICCQFDVDSQTKSNGFRSLVCITEKCLFKILEIGIYIQKSRDRFFFRSYHNFMEVESYSHVISRLFTVTQVALSLGTILDNDSLFADEEKYPDEVNGLMNDFETIGRECFYGRSFGFQFSPALQQSLNVIAVALAAYGDGFKRHNGNTARALSSVLHSGKYVVDPELRAKRIVELTQNVSMPFCKSFWSLTENHGIQHVPMLICPTLAVNKELKIAVEPLLIEGQNGLKTIDPPFYQSKAKIINARLLSYSQREGQGKSSSSESMRRRIHGFSKCLLLHCHGGGFVAQSSKSHEIYLRSWAKDLQCPILSIDYSLSPDAPYPEALNECFYVYNWAIKNCKSLGWTGERICLAGDSAGGNLMVALALKLIQEGLRLPDGLVIAYPPLRVQYAPSPSRMLALMDPLLPPGILKVCLRAYAGSVQENFIRESSSTSSLRTAVFDDFYNPFDIDLGDVTHFARRRNDSFIAGKRSYSDTNLVIGGHYCASRPNAGCIRCNKQSTQSFNFRRSSVLSENEAEETGLQMHPIQSDEVTPRTNADLSNPDVICTSDGYRMENAMKQVGNSEITKMTNGSDLERGSDQVDDIGISNTSKIDLGSKSKGESRRDIDEDVMRRSDSSGSNHRRSLSDSIAESFQRMRTNSGDFQMEKQLGKAGHLTDEGVNQTNRNGTKDYLPVEKEKGPGMGRDGKDAAVTNDAFSPNETNRSEYRALFIKETSDCVIIDRELGLCTSGDTPPGQLVGKVEKVYERRGSSDSISSTVKRMSKDPLMSPLEASDEALKQLPKLILVACSLDPLLDDSIDFVRRMKKLRKNSEIFIVDDLPHGFLNLNFASSEAKEASELIVACIKRVLQIGLRHENSLPLSPEAGIEELEENVSDRYSNAFEF